MSYKVYFPEAIIKLNEEIQHHPHLISTMMLYDAHMGDDIGGAFGCIAAYCDVVLNGEYTGDDLIKFADILYNKLLVKRGAATIVISDPSLVDLGVSVADIKAGKGNGKLH